MPLDSAAVPPIWSEDSSTSTDAPSAKAVTAAVNPAAPEPMSIRSTAGSDGVQQKAVGLWHICRRDLTTRLRKVGDEGDVAGEAIQLGNHHDRAGPLGLCHRAGELGGAIIFLAALNLGIFRRDPALASDVICNRLALRF